MTERKYFSDSEAYEVFVGQITPESFTQGCDLIKDSVDEFLNSWPYDDEKPPSWLRESLIRYLENYFEDQTNFCQVLTDFDL